MEHTDHDENVRILSGIRIIGMYVLLIRTRNHVYE